MLMKAFMKQHFFLISIAIFLIFSLLCAWIGYSASNRRDTEKTSISDLTWSLELTDSYTFIFSGDVPGQFEAYDGSQGFLIDETGRVLKELSDENDLGEGFHRFEKDGFYGVRDKSGRVIIEAKYRQIDDFHHGYTAVRNDIHYELLDKSGQKILSDRLLSNITYIKDGYYFVSGSKNYVLNVDTRKKIPLPSKVMGITTDESGSSIAVLGDDAFCYLSDSFTIPESAVLYRKLPEFSEGLGYAERYDDLIVDEKHNVPLTRGYTPVRGYMNKARKMVLPLPYEDIQMACPFSEGKALIFADKKVRCIDTDGKTLFTLEDKNTKAKFEYIFSGGFAPLTLDGIKEGVIDESGKFVIEPIFDSVGRINDGYVAVSYKGKCGILNLTQLQ